MKLVIGTNILEDSMPENTDNSNFYNALLTAGMSMYASSKKKKEDNKQIDWMNSILEDKRRYEEEKVARYKSSPAAQMSPMIMEMLVNAYGPKFKKYGINMPLDKMLAAINGGSTGAPGASGGVSEGSVPQRSLSQIANGEEPSSQRTLSDMIAAQLGRNNEYSKKTGVQTRMGVDSEYVNPADLMRADKNTYGGATAGSYGSREDTRNMGNINSRKGTLATGGTTTYTPPAAKPSIEITGRPDDRTIYASSMDYDNWDPPTIEGAQSQDPISIMTGNGLVDKIQGSAIKNVPGVVGGMFFGPGGAAVGKRVGNAFYNSGFDGKENTTREWGDLWSNLIFGRDRR